MTDEADQPASGRDQQDRQDSPAPETEQQKRGRLRVLLTDRLIEAVQDPKVKASLLAVACRFLCEANAIDTPPTDPHRSPTDTDWMDNLPFKPDYGNDAPSAGQWDTLNSHTFEPPSED